MTAPIPQQSRRVVVELVSMEVPTPDVSRVQQAAGAAVRVTWSLRDGDVDEKGVKVVLYLPRVVGESRYGAP